MSTENDFNVNKLWKSFYSDVLVLSISVVILLFSCVLSVHLSIFFGLIISFSFAAGCTSIIVALQHKASIANYFQKVQKYLGLKQEPKSKPIDCDICGIIKCNRHLTVIPDREPWRRLFISNELNEALASFYTKILNAFVESWFSLLSKNEDFVTALKHILREATCRLILKIKDLDISKIIAYKLLPCILNHHEIVQKMINNGVTLDKLADQFYVNEYQIHPAVRNRQSELDYLRAVARCLLPRICINQNLDSKVFFSLGRELVACWVLLPLMDVLANPNWLNAMIIEATQKRSESSTKLVDSKGDRVMFLTNFIDKTNGNGIILSKEDNDHASNHGTDFLTDQHQLYMFMQFLKREGAVDILRFYLDVDSLNAELMDPKITTDPAKLSSLQQQSETLLKAYKAMMERDFKKSVESLAEAQEDVKKSLKGKWQRAFHQTPEYFKMTYGGREISESDEPKATDVQTGTVSRFSSKLKGAIRGAIDGAPLEATEVPTVWDAFATDEPQPNSSNLAGNSTIYSSVTQKLRKERGQNLDAFICNFMQSIEQSTDVGEDVIEMKETKPNDIKPHPPGVSLVFGDLFGVKLSFKQPNKEAFAQQMRWLEGPSECLIYILMHVVDVSRFIVRFILGVINISKSIVDSLLCKGIDKLLQMALYEPRLTLLVRTVDEQLFGKEKKTDPSFTELLEQQRQARNRLAKISPKLANCADILQSPILNKHLSYCLLDLIIAELYPELANNMAKN
ncbi:sorting nexin-14-like [Contarinia nasturtii]|uniref:sorting nexin-14-like n=1 Tax=Contarinia nasturtii TaxID=265458 RepID=UPI0012D43569|nr:sorting nexin-14-like [Contarinia nasturtii]